jgi:hypothetical protein
MYWAGHEAEALIADLDKDGDDLVTLGELTAGTPKKIRSLFPEQKFHPLI